MALFALEFSCVGMRCVVTVLEYGRCFGRGAIELLVLGDVLVGVVV